MWDFNEYRKNEESNKKAEYLKGVHPNLKVKIVDIKPKPDNVNKQNKPSPMTEIGFKIISDGEYKDHIHYERFYTKAAFKMAWLAMACGLFETKQDGKKILKEDFNDPMQLAKKELFISTKIEEYNGNEYCRLDKMSSKPLAEESAEESVEEEPAPFY